MSPRKITSEKTVEKNLRKSIAALGGVCIKLLPVAGAGLPDRLVLLPHIGVIFVELKKTGLKPTKVQLERHRALRFAGAEVEVVAGNEQLDRFISSVTRRVDKFRAAQLTSRRWKLSYAVNAIKHFLDQIVPATGVPLEDAVIATKGTLSSVYTINLGELRAIANATPEDWRLQ